MDNKYGFLAKILELLNGISVSGYKSVLSLSEVFKMLNTLKQGLAEEDAAKTKIIDGLKATIRELQTPDSEAGGDVVGGEHYDIDFSGKKEDPDEQHH